jgi:flagellar biosynthesis protein FlhG
VNVFTQKGHNDIADKSCQDHSDRSHPMMVADKKLEPVCPRPELRLTQPKRREVRVLSFTSGKGGVGKTHIVVNLAYALQQLGARVMILDADLGLANVDVLLGLAPQFNLQHVLEGKKTLSDILVQGPAGMTILPASTGVCEVAQISEAQRFHLLDALDELHHDFDYLLVDTGAGISNNVIYFNLAAQDIVIVVTPEPTSLTDAYALMKVLANQYAEKRFKVVMNAVADDVEAKESFRRLSMVTERFLNVSLDYVGAIPHDNAFSWAVRQQKPLLELYPSTASAGCFYQLARHMLDSPGSTHPKGTIQFFWRRLFTDAFPPASEALHLLHGGADRSDDEGVLQ